jgi:hypothetical protein
MAMKSLLIVFTCTNSTCILYFLLLFLFFVLRMQPRALHMLNKHFTTEFSLSPCTVF